MMWCRPPSRRLRFGQACLVPPHCPRLSNGLRRKDRSLGAELRKIVGLCAAHVVAAGFLVRAAVTSAGASSELAEAQDFPILPLPPVIDGLIGFPQTYTRGRSTYLALIASEAEQRGLSAAVADAVVKVESGFN